jgi:hypothetical protein
MAQTNVQAFSGDVDISSNLEVANSKFSLDTNGTLKQVGADLNNNYIKLMKYFASGSNWKIATGSYTGQSFQWLSIRAKMTRLNEDVEIIQFNYLGQAGISRVRDSIVIGGGGSATQANEIKVYNKTSDSTYEIYLQIDSATSVEVEITHRGSTIDDDYSTVATANNGAIDETGLTKIYDSGTTTDLRLKEGNVGIGTTNPGGPLDVVASSEGDYIARFKNSGTSGDEDARIVIEASDADGEVQLLLQSTDESTTHKWNIGAGAGITPPLYFEYDSNFNNGTTAMTILHGGNVGIGTTIPEAKLDVRGDGMIFDKAEGDGTILTGLFNYTETQQAIDAGVDGGDTRGTITASTDIAPPPGTAGDVIAKFVNAYTSEAVTRIWYPGEIPIAVGTVIYFGVWAYATQNVSMEFFRFHDTGAQSVNFTYTTPNKWVWFEKTITSNRSYNFSNFRFDNNSAGRTVYLTGLTIRVGQSQNTGLPFTRRFCPQDNTGSVTAVRNLIAKEVNAREITSPDINVQYPGSIKFQRADGEGFGAAHKIFVESGKTISNASSGGGGEHSFRLNSSSNEFARIARVAGFYHRSAYNNGQVAKFIRHSSLHTSQQHILALYSNAPETDVENLDDEALKAHWSTSGNYVQVGSYAGKSSGTTWAETSDERIKTDIEDADLELCAENVRNIPFRRYRLRDEYIKTHEANDRTKLGWIAQEVQPVFPKAVITDEGEKYGLSNVMSLDSDQLFKTAYGAVKYLLNEVTTLKERITVLENNTS